MSNEFNIHLALIIDGQVEQLMLADERMAAIMLSNPLVVDITGPDGNPIALNGYIYDEENNTFTEPDHLYKPGPEEDI